jgi:2,3-dihydroxybiphenyl 1,2-dioxygenase
MTAVTQLGYVGLNVSKFEEWERYATDVLGLQPYGRNDDGSLSLRMDERHHRLILHPGSTDDLAYAGLEVADAGALTVLGDRLAAAGVEVTPGTPGELSLRRVAALLRCTDPNGIRVELHCGAVVHRRDPFRSPRPISGFVTGDQGLGHIVVHALDFDATMHFYRDLLGFRISDFAYVEPAPGAEVLVAFLHCNPRHHSFAFVQAPLPQRLNHVMLELGSVDDVGRAYYEAQDRGVPIAMSLGRHDNDQMLSFYMVSPSGFQVEYGWGARCVDDAGWRVETYRGGSVWGHRRA